MLLTLTLSLKRNPIVADMANPNLPVKSMEDMISNEYKVWKAETLAAQTGHIAAVQTTGMWQQGQEVQGGRKERDRNMFEIELAPGYR